MADRNLSKSRLLSYLQCPKRLFLEVHHSVLAEEGDRTSRVLQFGHEVGKVARGLMPDGILIGHDMALDQALIDTEMVLQTEPKRPIFEATFEHDGVLVRTDLLLPTESGRRLVEVKSATTLKEHYLSDCAIQSWVIDGAGHALERVELAHIDNAFVYPGEGDYRGLLRQIDVSEQIRPLIAQVPAWVEESRQTLAGDEPKIGVGEQCHEPYDCPFLHYCSPPETEYPVAKLPYQNAATRQLLADGIHDIRDVPAGRLTNPRHERMRLATIDQKPFLDPAATANLGALPYPRYYFDFETIQFAVPIWAGTRPYEQLPFQWSCHIETADGDLLHEEFLGADGEAPMRCCAESLIAALCNKGQGPVLVYNQSFEISRIRELAARFPDLAGELNSVAERIFDLWPVAKAYYYHPAMKGSWSLKSVLPTVAPELDYSNLGEVQDGSAAGSAYLEILDTNTSADRHAKLIRDLKDYCRQDTLALVKLTHYFANSAA